MMKVEILPLRLQAEIMDGWLAERLREMLPSLMRQAGVDMWILAGEEHHESPLLKTLLPSRIQLFNNGRVILLFHLQGEALECMALSRFDLRPIYRNAWIARNEDQWACLRRLVQERQPHCIGINKSEDNAFAGDLTVGLYRQLQAAVGQDARVVAADKLAVNWLQSRSAAELQQYPKVVQVAKQVVAEVFSGRTVRVGQTTAGDLVWEFRQRVNDLGLLSWFHPFVTAWRQAVPQDRDEPILAGDVLHVDFGLRYLGLCTDHQQLAYVLQSGEQAAPEHLRRLMAAGNCMQQILMEEILPGRSGNEVLAAALQRAQAAGIRTEVSSHPIGFHGHGAGPLIGYWGQQQGVPGRGDGLILENSCFALELVVAQDIPEWDNRTMYLGMEEEIVVGKAGASMVGSQQRDFLLIESLQ